MLGRGDLLALGDAIRTALSVVRIGLRYSAGKLLGLAAREPGAEPQAPPQPFARLPGEPHRYLPLTPAPSSASSAPAPRPRPPRPRPRPAPGPPSRVERTAPHPDPHAGSRPAA